MRLLFSSWTRAQDACASLLLTLVKVLEIHTTLISASNHAIVCVHNMCSREYC